MNRKHRKTLLAVFATPTRGKIKWSDIEALLLAAGCRMEEGRGSRVRFFHGETVFTVHRPHRSETDKGAVASVRDFLSTIGARP